MLCAACGGGLRVVVLRAKKGFLPKAPAADAPPVSSYDDTVWIICVYYHPTAIRHHNRGP
jgi:hypothetical protein